MVDKDATTQGDAEPVSQDESTPQTVDLVAELLQAIPENAAEEHERGDTRIFDPDDPDAPPLVLSSQEPKEEPSSEIAQAEQSHVFDDSHPLVKKTNSKT
jgi:hypothetical protein